MSSVEINMQKEVELLIRKNRRVTDNEQKIGRLMERPIDRETGR